MRKQETPIYKTNHFLNTQVHLNLIQKRIVHFLYAAIQKHVYAAAQGEKVKDVELTLYEDAYINIPTGCLDGNNQKHNAIYRAFKGLKEVDTSIKDECVDSFIYSAKRKDGNWRVLVAERTFKYMLEKAKQGVTPLGTLIYLSATSTYTISMYEQLRQRAGLVKWYTTPEELADLLNAPVSASKNWAEMKRKIVVIAQKELRTMYENKQSDICFDFDEKRGGRGNKVKELIFVIYQSEQQGKKQTPEELQKIQGEDFQFIAFTLNKMMVEHSDISKKQAKINTEFINKALSKLSDLNAVSSFARRLEKLIQKADSKGENPDDKGAYARFILEEDYNIES